MTLRLPVFAALPDVAHAIGLTPRALQRALKRVDGSEAATWHGSRPVVRIVHGRGGKSGKVYQVRLDSLPIALQNRAKEVFRDGLGVASDGARGRSDWDFWHHVIAPALAHPKGSRARGEAIAAAAEIERFLPGRPAFRVSARTIQRKLDAFEATGDLASPVSYTHLTLPTKRIV